MSEPVTPLPPAPIEPADLSPFTSVDEARLQAIIDLLWPQATLVAPCIVSEGFKYPEALRSVLVAIGVRLAEQGMGGLTQRTQTAPGFSINESVDTRPSNRSRLLWPSEISELQELCRLNSGETPEEGKAFSVDTAPAGGVNHSLLCSVNFGATYCSCGAELTQGEPLYEQDV